MNRDFKINFEWEDPMKARGQELRATWARMEILVGDIPITRLIDSKSKSIRNSIYGPLYPIAEWIAMNWWPLLHENEAPHTVRARTYGHRHNLHSASEGFSLPNLLFRPSGRMMDLAWAAKRIPAAGIEFLESGADSLPAESVKDEIADFLIAVIGRLESEGITGTPLQVEWNAIQLMDSDEEQFCKFAASLGEDPFSLNDDSRVQMVDLAARIPRELSGEFIAAIDFGNLAEHLRNLNEVLKLAATSLPPLNIPILENDLRLSPNHGTPWEHGYQLARHMREKLGLNGNLLADDTALAKAIGAENSFLDDRATPADRNPLWAGFDALLAPSDKGGPVFMIGKNRGDSRRYAFCRALYDSLSGASSALVSKARTDRQRANRAFAAELLAPSDLLRKRVNQDVTDDVLVWELAEEFGVSEMVIRHQVKNHHIAEVGV
jgi:hypothetical protein